MNHEEYYTKVASSPNQAIRSGFDGRHPVEFWEILNDVIYKLKLSAHDSLLDIGCGCSPLAVGLVKSCKALGAELTLQDYSGVIDQLKKEVDTSGVKIKIGGFPFYIPYGKFSKILMYNMIQCFSDPWLAIEMAAQKLAPGGRLLIGDVPNRNKKGRFLATPFGRSFDAGYKGVLVNELPKYENQFEFLRSDSDPFFNDSNILMNIIGWYRFRGFNAYLLPQPDTLPLHYTREDILIEKPL